MRLNLWVLLVLLTACSIEERGAPGTNPETKLDLSTPSDSIAVTLSAPATARRGDDVPVTLIVRNTTERTVELALAGREIAFDIMISRNDTVYWQRLHGQTIPSILQLKSIPPREAFELSDVWRADVPAGRYDVTGKILTDAHPLEPDRIRITIQ